MNTTVTHTIRLLGTGASCGVPSFYCGCKACEEALANPAARRGCAALLVRGSENTLIDAGPDLRMQLSLARARDIDQVLFTHEHFDHIGGISEFEFYVRLRTKEPLAIYAGSHTLANINKRFDYLAETLEPHCIDFWQSLEFDGVRYTALPATHGVQTFGYLIEKVSQEAPKDQVKQSPQEKPSSDIPSKSPETKRVAYFPDTGPLSPEVIEILKGIDVLIIDATFHGSNWMPASHLTIDEAVELAGQLGAKKTFLTHLAMHYDEPLTALELQMQLAPYQGTILAANDGLEITL